MRKHSIKFLFCLIICMLSYVFREAAAHAKDIGTIPLFIGKTEVDLEVTYHEGRPGVLLVNLHRDEVTSVEAGKEVLKNGGTLVGLKVPGQEKERVIEFDAAGKHYFVDPNRIFSDDGLWATLMVQDKKGKWQEVSDDKESHREAFEMVKSFREKLLAGLDGVQKSYLTGVVVALHNNEIIKGGVSIESYLPGGKFEQDAQKVSEGDKKNPHDFFLVTRESDFNKLANDGYNVVLQSGNGADDGSLSGYFAKNKPGIPYINCEAKIGSLEKQKEMLDAALK